MDRSAVGPSADFKFALLTVQLIHCITEDGHSPGEVLSDELTTDCMNGSE